MADETLKQKIQKYFQKGYIPTQGQFGELIDASANAKVSGFLWFDMGQITEKMGSIQIRNSAHVF